MSSYLKSNNIIQNTKEKRNIFNIRSMMIDLKNNFKRGNENLNCRLGCKKVEDTNHLNECIKIQSKENKFSIEKIRNGNIIEIKENSRIFIKKIEERDRVFYKHPVEEDTNLT